MRKRARRVSTDVPRRLEELIGIYQQDGADALDATASADVPDVRLRRQLVDAVVENGLIGTDGVSIRSLASIASAMPNLTLCEVLIRDRIDRSRRMTAESEL